jgi:hypothetical protein
MVKVGISKGKGFASINPGLNLSVNGDITGELGEGITS